jgi:L-fucose mutarotase/ribose pyranase (RbsD/FucU family)
VPKYRKCTEEDVYRILREAEARGERPGRESLARMVAVKCGYKIGTARNLVKSSEKMGFIRCSGWGRESLCKPVKGHYHVIALNLGLILLMWPYLNEEVLREIGLSEEEFEITLTHVVSRDKNSLAIAKDVIRWWRKFEELRQQIYAYILVLDSLVQREGKVIEDELRRLEWMIGGWRIPDALDSLYHMVYVKGERQLNELEGIAPKTVEVLRVTGVMIKQLRLLLVALLKLREKVDKLREVIQVMQRHYEKENRVQGFCNYCSKDVPKEIKNIVENLREAIYKNAILICEKPKIYVQLVYNLGAEPFTSISSGVLRDIIFYAFPQLKLIQ